MLLCVVAAIWTCATAGSVWAANGPPEMLGKSAIVVEAATGRVLWETNADAQMFPASLTKMMTGYLVAREGDLDRVVTISRTVASVPETGLYLEADERVLLRDLLKGALIWSANDAAAAAGEAVAESVDAFVDLMNQTAAELGATHTHFVNPHGLHDDNHYSTARDLATIAVQAMKCPAFREVVATKQFAVMRPEYVEPTTPEEKTQLERNATKLRRYAKRTYRNRNRLLRSWDLCDGVKTGYTRQAGNCLAASATRDGWQAISIVLDSENTWEDSHALLQWAFDNYEMKAIVRKGQSDWKAPVRDGEARQVTVAAAEGFETLVAKLGSRWEVTPELTTLEAPVKPGAPAGTLAVTVGERLRVQVPLVTAGSVELSTWGQVKRLSLPGRSGDLLLCLAAGVLLLGTAAKAARTRRYRVASGRRADDPRRAGNSRR